MVSLPRAPAAPRPFPYDRVRDAQLVAAAAQGDQRAWEAIWRRYAPDVRRVLRACIGVDAAIDDMVQETFLALHRSLHRMGEPEALRAYLLGCAVRLAAFEVRTRSRRFRWLRLTLTGELPEPPPRRESSEGREALHVLQGVLQELSADLRAAFVLRYVEDLSPVDVGRALGVSESTAKRTASRARDRVLTLAGRHPELAIYAAPAAKEHHQ